MILKGSVEKRCEWIFGQPMKPCPKCGGYNLAHRVPIRIDEPLPADLDARKMLGIWARARAKGATPLEGIAHLVCKDCGHKGPTVDVQGRTTEDVGKDPVVAADVKRLWNNQVERLTIK